MQLWILRHAKARHALPDEFDQDRALSDYGRNDARRLNQWLRQSGHVVPGKILVSPALRTRQTAESVLDGLNGSPPIHEERLWEAGDKDLVSIIKDHGEGEKALMLIGHNPGLEWLVRWLTGQRLTLGLQPGCLVIVNLDSPVEAGCGRIQEVIQPNDLT